MCLTNSTATHILYLVFRAFRAPWPGTPARPLWLGTMCTEQILRAGRTPSWRASASGFTDSTVAFGGSFYYVVTSVDSDNVESMYSNEVSAALRRVGAEAGERAIGKFWSRAFPVLFSRKKTGGGLLGGPLVFQTDAALAPSGVPLATRSSGA
jgi:hypothetical protein